MAVIFAVVGGGAIITAIILMQRNGKDGDGKPENRKSGRRLRM